MAGRVWLTATVGLILLSSATAIYLPGVLPREFFKGDPVELKVNKLKSTNSVLSFNNYDLPFCRPYKIKQAAENLGEHLTGETIENSPYQLRMQVEEGCKVLCRRDLTPEQIRRFDRKIVEDYYVNWIIDNLPAAATGITVDGSTLYSRGFPIGGVEVSTKRVFLYNHAKMKILIHRSEEYDGSRIVGFEVHPMSIKHTEASDSTAAKPIITDCEGAGYDPNKEYPRMVIQGPDVKPNPTIPVVWTYDVTWEKSDVKWASRWDIYLSMGDRYSDDIHWFAIVNSVIIAVFLTGLVAMIMVRALYRDLSRYNRVATDEEKAEDREEFGWKLVHGDVFRPPNKAPLLFAATVGVGSQVLGMAMFTTLFAAIGFLSPANRGSLMVGLIVLFLLMGVAAGYVAARTHKMFDGRTYQRTTMLVAFGFPGIFFTIVFILNLFVWHTGSVNAIPFGSMFAVLVLWFLVSVPLVFVGAYFGFKKEKVSFPVKVNPMPRQIPEQPAYLSRGLAMAIGGLLPFATVFVELFFILSSLWLDQYYYVFGFLLLVFILLAITCAEISIVLVYFQLCSENYKWWWNSFLVPGASGIYLFMYSIFYYQSALNMADSTSILLYFGYMAMISMFFTLITGTIGYLATLTFTRRIYGAIKVD